MLVSISEGDCLDGLFGAILLRAADDMMAVCRWFEVVDLLACALILAMWEQVWKRSQTR